MLTDAPIVRAHKAIALGRALRARGRHARRSGDFHVVLRDGAYDYVIAAERDGSWGWQQHTHGWGLYMWHGALTTPVLGSSDDAADEMLALVATRQQD